MLRRITSEPDAADTCGDAVQNLAIAQRPGQNSGI
jgi:hypothetical protein